MLVNRHFTSVAVCLFAFTAAAQAQDARVLKAPSPVNDFAPAEEFVPDAIVVEFDAPTAALADVFVPQTGATGNVAVDDVAFRFDVTTIRKQFEGADPVAAAAAGMPDLSGYYVIEFDAATHALDDVIAAYAALPNVVRVEKIGIHPVSILPNDGTFPSQWHLNQATDRDIDAPEAWNIETGDPSVIVAVLDTGVRYYHKDLGGSGGSASNPGGAGGNIWINQLEKLGTPGVDDDGNGFVDDWVGWDFVTGVSGCWSGEDCSAADNDPRDFNGHGTHCAGNVAALNNNGYATCSPAGGWGNGSLQPTGNGVKVMAMRIGWSGSYLGQEVGYVRMDFAASAFYYAANNGARVASCSWGSSNSGGVGAAVTYFVAAGGLVFKAAGNSNNQTADYLCGRSDVYCVAATNQNDQKASFSSYGTWVDVSCPGVAIWSSYHNHNDPTPDYIAALDGTSMATPLVASTAAAVWSQNPTWNAGQVWSQVRDTADNIDGQNPSYVGRLGSGRINLYNAVNTVPVNTPPSVTISSPANGSTVTQGTTVNFSGGATDTQDGNISGFLVWTSNLQGQIGTGASFSRSDLVLGTHTITASVTDSGGLSGSASISLTVQSPGATPPAAPSGVTATRIAAFTARVNWNDNSSNEDGFQIERQRRVGNQWTETTTVGSVGANVTTFTSTVSVAGKYRYRVRAFNAAGNSAWSNWAQVTLNN